MTAMLNDARSIARYVLCLCFTALFCLCAQPGTAAGIKLSNQFPPAHHLSKSLLVFAEKVKEYSGGELSVEIFDSGSLFRDEEIVRAIRSGSVEIGLVPVNKWSGILPAVDVFEVPFIFRDFSSLAAFLQNGAAALLDEAFSTYGAKVLFWVDYGYVQFFNSKRPLKTPADFKGLTMRSFSAGDQEILKSLGAAPTIISSSELYLALQRGTVDGSTTGMPAAVARKIIEVQKYMTLSNYSTAEFLVQANLKWWSGLPEAQRQAILRASADVERLIREEAAASDAAAFKSINAAGLTTHILSEAERAEFVKATQPARAAYLKKSGALGARLLPIADALNK